MQFPARCIVNSVQIAAPRIGAIVPQNYPIRVQEWNNFEDVEFSQIGSHWIRSVQEEVDETVQDEAGRRLAWVDSGGEEYYLER